MINHVQADKNTWKTKSAFTVIVIYHYKGNLEGLKTLCFKLWNLLRRLLPDDHPVKGRSDTNLTWNDRWNCEQSVKIFAGENLCFNLPLMQGEQTIKGKPILMIMSLISNHLNFIYQATKCY